MHVNKKLLITLGIALVSLVPKVSAQSPTVTQVPIKTPAITITATPTETISTTPTITTTPALRDEPVIITINAGTQSPWNKHIPLKVTVTPKQSGSRLTLNWQKKAGLIASPISYSIANPVANQPYTISFSISPQATGYQRTVIEAILTTNSSNFVTSKELVFTLNQNKEVLPISSSYSLNQMLMYVSIFLFFFILIPGGLYFLFNFIRKNVFPKWYARQIQGTPS